MILLTTEHQTNYFRKQIFLRMLYKLLLIIFLIIITLCSCSQKNPTVKDEIIPYKTQNFITIDGILNEPVWQKTLFADEFYDEGDTYTNTKAFFTYDAGNLYAAFKCNVKDTLLLHKDRFEKDYEPILENEWVAFCVDTYNDGITAYAFIVDAAGNQLDGALNPPSRDLSFSFSSNWTSAIKTEHDGYIVEMKIPLDNLPIIWDKDNVEMALQLIRHDKQNNRMVQTPLTKNISQFQKIILQEIDQTHPKNLSGVNISERLAYKKSKIDVTTFMGRCQGGDASVMDYLIFKKRDINGADNSREFHFKPENGYISKAFENTEAFKNINTNVDFETMLERAQTSAFMVLRNDTIIYENYFNGFNKDSIFTSFSVAKSFVSTLVGLAISDGYIKSENDKITTYLPELLEKDTRFSDITIKDLLSMSSGIAYSEDGFPSDDDITYVSPNLRKATFENVRIAEQPGKHWLYNNYNPLLLGIILEKTTGKSVSKYTEEKLWLKMGGSNASWSLDEHGFEKMESGINCSVYDYARFAVLLLNNGKYKDTQVISETWVNNATQPQKRPQGYYDYLLENNVYYNYFWWGKFRDNQEYGNDFFGLGNKGEYVYVCPQKKLTIIRLGFEYGFTPGPFSWPEMFFQFATDFKTSY
ncbi:MAG: serine hydrolase [Bacteroidetes bacterium]|nr:serine hydrolase [Bacteroidota bacterium]